MERSEGSDSLFRDMFLQSPISTWVVDQNGILVFENTASRRMLGLEFEDQIIGKYNLLSDPNFEESGYLDRARRVFDAGETFDETIDYDFSRVGSLNVPKATHKILHIIIYPLIDASGTVRYAVVQHEDFTERQHIEDELRQSEERFRILSSAGFEGIIIHDKGTALEANDAFLQLTGYDRSEVVGKDRLDMLAEESRDIVLQHVLSSSEEPYEVTVKCKDGSLFIAEIRGKAINYKGIQARMTAIRDITKEKEAEKARIAMHEQYEAQQKQFYRQTIKAATGGKLIICDLEDLQNLPYEKIGEVLLREPGDVAVCRHRITDAATSLGMDASRAETLALCVGEAATNALKHAQGGTVTFFSADSRIIVRVSDQGPGMDALVLPRATLELGFSTIDSMGMGYAVILALADRTLLSTSTEGTTVVIEMDMTVPLQHHGLESLRNNW